MESTFACLMSKTPAFIHTEFIRKYAQHDKKTTYICDASYSTQVDPITCSPHC